MCKEKSNAICGPSDHSYMLVGTYMNIVIRHLVHVVLHKRCPKLIPALPSPHNYTCTPLLSCLCARKHGAGQLVWLVGLLRVLPARVCVFQHF